MKKESNNKKVLIVANVAKEHIRKFHIPIIEYLKEQEWTVDVACKIDVPVPEAYCQIDLPCDRNPFKGGILKSAKILEKTIVSGNYDAVICNTLVGSIVARLAMRKMKSPKLFYIVHGLHFFEGASATRWAMGYPMEKILAPMTDVLITINSADDKMVRKHLKPGAFERIPGIGCKLDKFRDCQVSLEERNQVRESFGFGPDDMVLVYVAEINSNKNQSMLVEAMRVVEKNITGMRLLLVGPEHDDGKLAAYCQEQGLGEKVVFAGWRDDVPRLLKCADIYVASSLSEGLPINIIEAMACDLPVVAGKNRGHSEIIDHGVNGFLVEKNDAAGMAQYVERLVADPALRERLTACAQVDIQKYEVGNVCREIERILEKHIGE